jgi:hypothetical protein
MHRFWNDYIGPIVELTQPRRILEIGAEFGWNTRHILAYCRASGATADIVDPAPAVGFHEILSHYSEREFRYHPLKGVTATTIGTPSTMNSRSSLAALARSA